MAGRRWQQLLASEANGDWVQIQTWYSFQDCYRKHNLALCWDPHPKCQKVPQFMGVLFWFGCSYTGGQKGSWGLILSQQPNSGYEVYFCHFPHYWVLGERFRVRHLNSDIYMYMTKHQKLSLVHGGLSMHSAELRKRLSSNTESS